MKRALALAVAVALGGCGGGASHRSATLATTSSGPTLKRGLALNSPAFKSGGQIPRVYACDGQDLALPLRISGVPQGTHELLLEMRDPDAPGGDFVHWALAGIPPSTTSLPTSNVVGGRNSFGTLGYRGPCPPRGGKPHHYVITLSALSGPSGLRAGFSTESIPRSAELAIATLEATYSRH